MFYVKKVTVMSLSNELLGQGYKDLFDEIIDNSPIELLKDPKGEERRLFLVKLSDLSAKTWEVMQRKYSIDHNKMVLFREWHSIIDKVIRNHDQVYVDLLS